MFGWIKKIRKSRHEWKVELSDVKLYPSNRSCVKKDMNNVHPQQLPPLMVRKAAWRR